MLKIIIEFIGQYLSQRVVGIFYNSKFVGNNSNRAPHFNKHKTTHAEIDALNKIKHLVKNNKLKNDNFNLIVIRVNSDLKLQQSAPCFHCTKEIQKFCKSNCINIHNLYYSNSQGEIDCVKFTNYLNNYPKTISASHKNYKEIKLKF